MGPDAGVTGGCRISIPPNLHARMHTKDRDALRTEQDTDTDLLLSSEDMRALFEGPVERTVSMATTHLKKLGTTCSVVSSVISTVESDNSLWYRDSRMALLTDVCVPCTFCRCYWWEASPPAPTFKRRSPKP